MLGIIFMQLSIGTSGGPLSTVMNVVSIKEAEYLDQLIDY
jgi:hypothetical protein